MIKRISMLLVFVFGLLISFTPASAQDSKTVTLLHMSDYHSHAVPFYSEGQNNTGGLARAIAYLRLFAQNPNALVFSGGDTVNLGTPAWSDKYRCVEWSMFNDIIDAMAYGNHEGDYGADTFGQCRAQITYPILSANTVDASGQPLFANNGKNYAVFETNGVKIGVFGVAGSDFERLIRPALRPYAGAVFADRIAAARTVVQALREQEQVNAVVLIGHSLREDDIALAQAVPGIDIIFGSHSHRKEELFVIPSTNTHMISSFQYLTYISKLDLTFTDGKLNRVDGGLVRMGNDLPEDPQIAQMVAQMQRDLEADPQFAPLFQSIGQAASELSTDSQFVQDAALGNFVMDIFRASAGSHIAVSTASSFREPLAPGLIQEEDLRTSLPYKNKVLIYDLAGAQIQELLNYSVSRTGSDFFSQVAGVRFNVVNNQATNIQILKDPANSAAGYAPLDPAATYAVATTDFQGKIAAGYKEIFAKATAERDPGIADVRDNIRAFIQANSPIQAAVDGRITVGAATAPAAPQAPATAPAALPNTGGVPFAPLVAAFGLWLVLAGLLVRRRA
ncbi:MAG: bifunctional metallophosphatase/5'-nucleotidase [Roseiflexaceae bacterium]|nr:bifunctional metallophosphatase/5'-nucleotidase [Roseiflexaceae bacterium]